MLLRMKEKVDLNNNGLSIESTARLFHGGKWVKRHILCKKPVDLSVPIFYVFKNKRDKQKNVANISIVMTNYIGFESGFEHKKRSNTLSLLTTEACLLLSFDLAESLVVWEAWLKNICGQTVSFYMQLKRIPSNWKCTYALLKEVRCHVRESYMGIIYGRPQEVILHVDLNKEAVDFDDSNLVTIHPSCSDEAVVLLCPKSPVLKKCVTAARIEGALPRLLNREQYEGDWIPKDEKKRSIHGDQTSQITVNMSELASLMRTPEPVHNNRIYPGKLGKGLSKSQYVFEGPSGHAHRPVSRSNSTAAYYSTAPMYHSNGGPILRNVGSVNYVNIGVEHNYVNHNSHSRRASANENDVLSTKLSMHSVKSAEGPIYCNIPFDEDHPNDPIYDEIAALARPKFSHAPEYVNIQVSGGVPHIIDDDDYPQSTHIQMMSEKVRRRSDNSVNHQNHNVYPSTSNGRSVPDFVSAHYDESKQESWKRAKKFFSNFKMKSQSDLHHNNKKSKRRSIIKSSSTGALQFASSVSYFPRGSTGSETDDAPPPLNVSISAQMTRSQPMLSFNQQPPAGLIQAPNEVILLKKPSRGVGAILARRKIRGSFTKYDGERATHMYQPQASKEKEPEVEEVPVEPVVKDPPPRPPKSDRFDGITSAVNRGQEKLKMCDRRASNVSFHKVNVNADLPLEMGKQENKEGTSSRPLSRADSAGPRRQILTQLTNSKLSNSHSDYTRSSNESLSSDARSRISIRKKHKSPPRQAAPFLPSTTSDEPLYVSRILLRPSSSVDSLNSEQTARSSTPPLLLPQRSKKGTSQHSLASETSRRTAFANYCDLALPTKANSSSSNSVESKRSAQEYMLLDPVTTRAAQEALSLQQPLERSRSKSSSMTGVAIGRRKSQGQGSSDSMSVDQPTRQGFFKKYRKMRRARKNAGSLNQLDL